MHAVHRVFVSIINGSRHRVVMHYAERQYRAAAVTTALMHCRTPEDIVMCLSAAAADEDDDGGSNRLE